MKVGKGREKNVFRQGKGVKKRLGKRSVNRG